MGHLTFDQITFKASHNSYERSESLADQLTFQTQFPYNGGCMGVELDIWRHSSTFVPYQNIANDYFTVAHALPGHKALSLYLSEILKWHVANPAHEVILITLDIKSHMGGYDNFHDEIDTYIKCYFDEQLLLKPGDIMQDSQLDLCANVLKHGWPILKSLKGKFIFCLSGNESWKLRYANTDIAQRYCFSDEDKPDSDANVSPPKSGNIVFFNFHIFHANRAVWMKTIPRFAASKQITRVYEANSKDNWDDCIQAKVSAIATNKISNHTWCLLSNTEPYCSK